MMYNTFNMGIGMVLALKAEDADKAIRALEAAGEKAYLIGSIAAGEKGVDVC
jgi:phosphoribosylformylglycinamidine cyclo-ligase